MRPASISTEVETICAISIRGGRPASCGSPRRRINAEALPKSSAAWTAPSRLIEVIRGPRQVGKTTAVEQAIQHLLSSSVSPSDIFFVRFDQEVLREHPGGWRPVAAWYQQAVRRRPFETGRPCYLFLDEITNWTTGTAKSKTSATPFPCGSCSPVRRAFLSPRAGVKVLRQGVCKRDANLPISRSAGSMVPDCGKAAAAAQAGIDIHRRRERTVRPASRDAPSKFTRCAAVWNDTTTEADIRNSTTAKSAMTSGPTT